MTAPVLRDYQVKGIENLLEAYRGGARAPLLVLPTGGGKTVIFSTVAVSAAHKGKRTLILCHGRELICQATDKLRAAGVEPGIIAPGFPATDALVQVGSVQTLAARIARGATLPPVDLVVLDEAHHVGARTWLSVLDAMPGARILGVTATPIRADGKGLGVEHGGIFDRLVAGPSVAGLIAGGHLVGTKVYAPRRAIDLTGIRTRAGDFDQAALDRIMRESSITGDSVSHYGRHAPGLPAIVFAVSIAHAEEVAAAFRAAGWRAQAVSGATPAAERDAAIQGLATGSVQVLCSVDVFSEGTDVPACSAVILLRPTKSVGLFLQQCGRGLRPAPGKDRCIVLDHAGNVARHGLPEAPREWSLAGAPKKQKAEADEPKDRTCDACGYRHPPAPVCPRCGQRHAGEAREVERVDGELAELTEAERERLMHLRTRPLHELVAAATSRKEMHEIGRARGFKPGWAWHQWNRKQAERVAEAAA